MVHTLAPLTRDVGCRKDMMWATKLECATQQPAAAVADFLRALERHGFTAGAGGIPGRLVVYDHDTTGHRIVIVEQSGRIQIRLDALTRHEARPKSARAIYQILELAASEAAGVHSSIPRAGGLTPEEPDS